MADATNNSTQEATLDVTAEQIARTYATGFLRAVNYEEAAVSDLEAVNEEVLRQHPQFDEAMRSAFLDHDVRVAMIDNVLGGRVAPAVVNLLKVLSNHGRMELAGEVSRQARKLLDKKQGRADVLVRLAREADQSLLGEIEQTIRNKTGLDPVVSVEVDPELVGGLEIRVGDTVFDGTVRTALKKSHKEIVNQTVNAIESNPERFTLAE